MNKRLFRFFTFGFLALFLLALQSCPEDFNASSRIFVNPSGIDFGNLSLSSSARRTVQISNASGQSFIVAASISGDGKSAYSIVSQPGKAIPDGGVDSVIVQFSPTEVRTYSAAVTIGSEQDVQINLLGTGVK